MNKLYKKNNMRCLSGTFTRKSTMSDIFVFQSESDERQKLYITDKFDDINLVVNGSIIMSIRDLKNIFYDNRKKYYTSINVCLFFAFSFKKDINDVKYRYIFDRIDNNYMDITSNIENNKIAICISDSLSSSKFVFKYIILSFRTIKMIIEFNNNKNNSSCFDEYLKKRDNLRHSFFTDPYFYKYINNNRLKLNLDDLINYLLSIQNEIYFNILF